MLRVFDVEKKNSFSRVYLLHQHKEVWHENRRAFF